MITEVPTPRYHAGITLVQQKLHIIGGFHSDATFDRTTGKDTKRASCGVLGRFSLLIYSFLT